MGANTNLSRRAFLASASAAAVVAGLPAGASVPVAPTAAVASPSPPLTLARLKELSERSWPVLQRHFGRYDGEGFLAVEGENYHGLRIQCDCPGRSDHGCARCNHPLAGTPMIGGMSGYYEPEWDEETAYETLRETLWWSERPGAMTDAEWAAALAIVGMTPASHAQRMADFEREMAEMDAAVQADETLASHPEPSR